MMMLESISITAQEYCVVFVAFILYNFIDFFQGLAHESVCSACPQQDGSGVLNNLENYSNCLAHSFQKLITLFFFKSLPSPLGEGFGGEAL